MEFIDTSQIIKFFSALVLVIGLMLGLSMVMRRINGEKLNLRAQKRRLKVVESVPLDNRRRAILLRRDDRDHLVILGPTGETVVESGIIITEDGLDAQTR